MMQDISYASLHERALIRISGEDRLTFLQGLVSNDISPLSKGEPVYTALLSPQGKFLHDFFLVAQQDNIILDVAASSTVDLLRRLTLYRLRSQVAFEIMQTLNVAAIWGKADIAITNKSSGLTLYQDPRLQKLGYRLIGEQHAINDWCTGQGIKQAEAEDYDYKRLELGVPDGACDMIAEKSFILPFGFEELHGVDFGKGCYVGQEVTARSKHLGQIRKFIYQVRLIQGTFPSVGTQIYLEEAAIGELRSHRNNIGLALLNNADAAKAGQDNMPLHCGDARLTAMLPLWSQPRS